jgi:hypothetical protein
LRIEEKRNTKFWQENLKEKDQLGDLGIDREIILQEVLGRTNHLLPFDMAKTAYEMENCRRYIQQGNTLHIHDCENLKSNILLRL